MKLLPYLRKTKSNTLVGSGPWAWCGVLVVLGWYASMSLRNGELGDWLAGWYNWRKQIMIGSEGEWAYAGSISIFTLLSCALMSVVILYFTLQYRACLRDLGRAGRRMKKLAWSGVLVATAICALVFLQLNFLSPDTLGLWPLLLFGDAFLALFAFKLIGLSGASVLRLRSLLVISVAARCMLGAGVMLPWVVLTEAGTANEMGLGQLIFGVSGMIWLVIMRSMAVKNLMAYMPGVLISLIAFALYPPVWLTVALILGLSLPVGRTHELNEASRLGEAVRRAIEPWVFVLVAPVLAFIGGGVLMKNPDELTWLSPMMVSSLLIGLGAWPVGFAMGCALATLIMKRGGRRIKALPMGHIVRVGWWSAAGLAMSPVAMIAISSETEGLAAYWRFGIAMVCILSVLTATATALLGRVRIQRRRRKLEQRMADPLDPRFDISTLSRR